MIQNEDLSVLNNASKRHKISSITISKLSNNHPKLKLKLKNKEDNHLPLDFAIKEVPSNKSKKLSNFDTGI